MRVLNDGIPAIARSPAGASGEALRVFLRYPHPLALATLEGNVLLVNAAWSARIGEARLAPESFRSLPESGEADIVLALRLPGGNAMTLPARVLRMPDRLLLALDESPDERRRAEIETLRLQVSELERLAATDALTGAWNRGHFERVIRAELARSLECQQPVSLVLLDVDHFKRVNDTLGHGVGDSVLRELVQRVRSHIRASDVLFRWGGEEFAILVSSAGYRGAERLAEKIRQAVAAQPFRGAGSVTVSLGVAEHSGSEDRESWFTRLDEALYAAKRGGRDRVVVDRRGNSDAWTAQAGAFALRLVWQEAYESGNAIIDREHQQLFDLANGLIDAVAHADEDPECVRAALDRLQEHVQRHFADEEGILAEHGYVDLPQHKRAHAGLLRRAGFLREQVDAGNASLGAVVQFLAQDVVARHMMAVDRAFFPLFGKPAAEAAAGTPH